MAIHGKIRKKGDTNQKKIKKKRNHWQSDEEHIEQLEIAKKDFAETDLPHNKEVLIEKNNENNDR